MHTELKPYYRKELDAYRNALKAGHYQISWRHLERAHILAQPYAYEHTAIHWKMLRFGLRIRNYREVLGQLPRLIFGGVKSFVGKVPIGNTGGADVPPLKPMEIPRDLQDIINRSQVADGRQQSKLRGVD